MVAEIPADFLNENALQAEGNVAMPLEVMCAFAVGRTLAEPEKYSDKMWFTHAFHHAARAKRTPPKVTRLTRVKPKVFLSNAPSLCQRKIL